MTWLTVVEYLRHKLPWICSTCRKHFPVLSSFTICNQINTTGATSGAGTAYPSVAPEFTLSLQWGSCYSIFSFICMLCRSLFVLLFIFFWPLCCLFFFNIRILITPLVSSSSSHSTDTMHYSINPYYRNIGNQYATSLVYIYYDNAYLIKHIRPMMIPTVTIINATRTPNTIYDTPLYALYSSINING